MTSLRQRPKLWIRAAMVAALAVLALFIGIELSGAQQTDYSDWSLMICSHPGASRHSDGSLLNGDPTTGDSIMIHPTHGDYTESISTGGVWENHGWGTYIAWRPLLVEHNDGTCSLRASFRIARWGETAQVARAEFNPCPVELPADQLSPSGNRIRSIRVWLNRDMNLDELNIPCDANDSGALLPGQEPPTDESLPDDVGDNSNGDNVGSTTVTDEPDAEEQPTNNNPPPTSNKPAPTNNNPAPTNNNPPPTSNKPAPTNNNPAPTNNNPAPTNNKPAPTNNNPAPTNNNPAPTNNKPAPTTTTTTTTSTSTPAESDDEPSQPPVSVSDTEKEEQTSTPTPAVAEESSDDDLLEQEGSDEADELMELENDSLEADDLMEEAETLPVTRVGQERPTDSGEQAQITRPGTPRTGTGGAATESTGTGIAIALTAFVATAVAIGIVSLTLYRRRHRAQSQ